MVDTLRHIPSDNPDETRDMAARLAAVLKPGDTVLLEGPIGAGKSHFARSAIQTMLLQPEDIPSPTYTLVQTYDGVSGEIWHADLYRMGDASEVHELGLWAAFEDAICFVEWPDRLGTDIPGNALIVELVPGDDDTREVRFSSRNPDWDTRLEEVFNG